MFATKLDFKSKKTKLRGWRSFKEGHKREDKLVQQAEKLKAQTD